MTSAQSMHPGRPRARCARVILAVLSATMLAACSSREKLVQPTTLSAPYDRPQVWAVAPFVNESGVSKIDTARVSDLFAEQIQNVRGIDVIPVNRVLLAMRRMELPVVDSPAHAMSLMNVLGVDGLIVGTITAYDPYAPPKLGAAVQLYRSNAAHAPAPDPVALTRASSEPLLIDAPRPGMPVAQAAGVFDASNHEVLAWLDEYAVGRTEPASAYGKRIYLVNMELYTQFVAWRLMHDLLGHERVRMSAQAASPPAR